MIPKRAIWVLLAICIISRLITTIYYVEDIDCLRFALSAYNYDIAEMRPHFPGYAVYCFLLKGFYLLTAHLAISFSILGGIAIFLIIISSVSLVSLFTPGMKAWPLVLLLFLNPQLWAMSNSYMPDIFGLGLLTCCIYLFSKAYLQQEKWLWYFYIVTGLLMGVRLSYAPMLLLPGMILLWKYYSSAWKQIVVLSIAILVWLLPMIAVTGWHELFQAAQIQAEGHFTKWGGSVISSNAGWGIRLINAFKSIWADGMGGWWLGRGWENLVLSVLLLPFLFMGFIAVLQWMRRNYTTEKGRLAIYLFVSLGIYLLWAFFFQNIIHKPRHVMPVIPVLCILTIGYEKVWKRRLLDNKWFAVIEKYTFILLLLVYSLVTYIAVYHHFQPTAISQIKDHLLQRNNETSIFVAPAVMGYYMQKQYWDKGEILDADSDISLAKTKFEKGYHIFSIAPLDSLLRTVPVKTTDFYHDQYVNRMWSHLTLYEYQR